MTLCRRLMRATAVLTLTFQVMVTAVAAVSACADRPHTHGGAAAPDCPMHHQQSPAADAANLHEHHGDAHHPARSEASRISCHCPSDALSFLITEIGVIADRVSVRVPTATVSTIAVAKPSTIDLRIAPLAPPPRSVLS